MFVNGSTQFVIFFSVVVSHMLCFTSFKQTQDKLLEPETTGTCCNYKDRR